MIQYFCEHSFQLLPLQDPPTHKNTLVKIYFHSSYK
uniref:Uncharacterized protein n=1 Tax=Anguilla anguilla TaxID=7936 RepID=A0A0E9VX60_ANGAN